MSALAEQLRKLRGNKTLYQVQQDTGLPRITISRYERDENTPSIQNLKKLSNYYNVHYNDLRSLYYDDILNDTEERSIVLSWALKQLLPVYSSIDSEQLKTLVESSPQDFCEALNQLLTEYIAN